MTLSAEDCEVFRMKGYLGPYALCPPDEMAGLRERIDREVRPRSADPASLAHRHLDSRLVYDLCAAPAIVRRVESLIGPDLLLWSSNFWLKEPGAGEIPWHQDIGNWPIEPPLTISAWLAVDEVTAENACVEVIPGSHCFSIPVVPSKGAMLPQMADPSFVDASQAVNMELKPGEFFLFNERLLHRSQPNRSPRRRLGLGVRITLPFVKVYYERQGDGKRGGCILLGGVDRFGINRLHPAPR